MIMSTNKTLTILAASGVFILAVCRSTPKESIDQENSFDNSAARTDPGASGTGQSIVDQRRCSSATSPVDVHGCGR
jgi:hypothetical protein